MQRWEYTICEISQGTTDEEVSRQLSVLGRDGWRIIACTHVHTGGVVWTLEKTYCEAPGE